MSYELLLCPEQDSNLHTVTGTSPSSWRVYQFHHLGVNKIKDKSIKIKVKKDYFCLSPFVFCLLKCPEQDSNLHIIADTSP